MSGKRSSGRRATRPGPRGAPADGENALLRAVRLHQAGDLAGAAAIYESLLDDPRQQADALHYLGLVALQGGDPERARQRIEAAIERKPAIPQFHCNLGNARKRLGDHGGAALAYRQAIALDPGFPEARFNLGVLLADSGDDDGNREAIGLLREALARREAFPAAWSALGRALYREERIDEALTCYRRSLDYRPDQRDVRLAVCHLVARTGDSRGALAGYADLVRTDPGFDEAWQGMLMAMNYVETDLQAVFRAHAEFGARLVAAAPAAARHALPARPSGERLRVGILSPDLRRHAMRFFIRPILRHVERGRIELFAYDSWPRGGPEDPETARFRPLFEHWREIAGLDDDETVALIRNDAIDLLLDLAGHTAGGRVGVLARRAAPVQATLLGYMNTTGISTVDYRIADGLAIPAEFEAYCTEAIVRLPHCQWCYAPDPEAVARLPQASPLPLLRNGFPTFGLFHTPAKMSDEAFACWGRLFASLPDARLVVALWGEVARRRFLERCVAAGIPPTQVDCRPPLPHGDYLRLYEAVDVSLDTFPFSGGTVSFESLWMGVPFVTLAANSLAGRGGVSILTALGLEGLVARSPDEVVALNRELVADPGRLAEMRHGLRSRMAGSPLMDEQGYAADFWERVLALRPRSENADVDRHPLSS